jgi:aconitate hydratase
MKAKGKCTTDHISAAGPWLKYRGHLENISGNLFIGAVNAFTDEVGQGKDQLDGTTKSFPDIAKHYMEAGQPWVAIGDENYGEGSSREHAAMEPRYRLCKVVITRSFARIHEANLKKQGVLPLTFADPASYDLIGEDDRLSFLGLAELTPDVPVTVRITHPDGSTVDFEALHTMNQEHIEWFQAGGALNIIRQKQGL